MTIIDEELSGLKAGRNIRREWPRIAKQINDSSGGGGGLTPDQLKRLTRIGIPLRVDGDFTLLSSGHLGYTNSGIVLDVYPDTAAANVTITLPPSTDPEFAVTVSNQTASDFLVFVNDSAASQILEIPPVNTFLAFYDSVQVPNVAAWELIHAQGSPVPQLSVAKYGDFDGAGHQFCKVREWNVEGLGSDFTRLPPEIVLIGAATYKFAISQVNSASEFKQAFLMSSPNDPTNRSLNRWYVRSGANFGAAAASGWVEHATASDLVANIGSVSAISAVLESMRDRDMTKAALCYTKKEAVPTNATLDTVFAAGTGDEFMTPPDNPQPVTGGVYNGYQKVTGWTSCASSGDLSIVGDEFVVGKDGDYESEYAWATFSSSVNTNTIGFIFAVERAGFLNFSQRPTGVELPTGGNLDALGGGGFLDNLLVGDKISVWLASEKAATISIHDSNLGVAMRIPEELKP